jgi:hypothetical protein
MGRLPKRAAIRLKAGLGLALTWCFLNLGNSASAQAPSPFAFFVAGSHKKAPAPEPPPVKATLPPAQTIPVEPLGFAPPGEFYLGMRNSLASLDFLDENHLLFTFRVPGLIHRDFTTADPSDERKIRAVVLQLPQGTVQAETVWTVHDRQRYLWMLDEGKFLLRDRDNLEIGDATLQVKPFLHFPGEVLWVELDPSHKYVVTGSAEPPATASRAGDVPNPSTASATLVGDSNRTSAGPDMVLRILRRDTGKVMLVSHVRSAIHLPINSDGYVETLRGKGNTWVLNMNYFSGGSKILGSVESTCSPTLDFVSPVEILVTACSGSGDSRLGAVTTAGRRLWDDPMSNSAVWPILVRSPDGSRLARETLLSNHSVNTMSPLGTEDIRGQDVQILDAATGKVVLRAAAKPIFDAGGNVAISPSGRRVAILMAEGIQIFDLPVAPTLPDNLGKQIGQ